MSQSLSREAHPPSCFSTFNAESDGSKCFGALKKSTWLRGHHIDRRQLQQLAAKAMDCGALILSVSRSTSLICVKKWHAPRTLIRNAIPIALALRNDRGQLRHRSHKTWRSLQSRPVAALLIAGCASLKTVRLRRGKLDASLFNRGGQ